MKFVLEISRLTKLLKIDTLASPLFIYNVLVLASLTRQNIYRRFSFFIPDIDSLALLARQLDIYMHMYIHIALPIELRLRESRSLRLLTINVCKWNRALWLLFNIQSADYGVSSVTKISLYSTFMRSTVRFWLCLEVDTAVYSCETNLLSLHQRD